MVEFYISERLRRKYYDVRQRVYESAPIKLARNIFLYDLFNILLTGLLLFDISMTQRESLLFRPKCWLAFLFGTITILKLTITVLWPLVCANSNFRTPMTRKRRKKIYGPYYATAMAETNERNFTRTESYMSFEKHDNAPVLTSTPTDCTFSSFTSPIKLTGLSPGQRSPGLLQQSSLSLNDSDPAALLEKRTQQLKNWLSLTILRQIALEFDLLNEGFQYAGFRDVSVGCVPRQRLQRFADMPCFVRAHAPSLPLIIDYLSVSENQSYLVERLRTLAFGYYIIDYNAQPRQGAFVDVPSDAAIIFHVFCVFMDNVLRTQAPKRINEPARPFFDNYVLMDNDGQNSTDIMNNYNGCAIYCSDWKQPDFDFISQLPLERSVQSTYNVFTVIIEFLWFLKVHYDGYLNGIDLNTLIIAHVFD